MRRPCTAESNLAEFKGATNVYNVEQPDPAVSVFSMRSGNVAVRERGAVVIPPHCPSCRAPVTLACPNLTEALIVCSNEAVRPLPCVLATPMPPTRHTSVVAPRRSVSGHGTSPMTSTRSACQSKILALRSF